MVMSSTGFEPTAGGSILLPDSFNKVRPIKNSPFITLLFVKFITAYFTALVRFKFARNRFQLIVCFGTKNFLIEIVIPFDETFLPCLETSRLWRSR